MNLAVIISVSEYLYAPALPGCRLDAQHMHSMLQLTGRFDDILVLDRNPSTPEMRAALKTWIRRYKGQLVDEVFWYFTGHGMYYGDARFCGHDFSPQLLEATSIANHEVDDLLRLLQPRVVVKVIDACQSGAPYIKGHPPAFRRALEDSRLESFISMCSCTHEQSSYAHLFGSDFTLTWLDAVLQRRSGEVSYRQIEQHLIRQFKHQLVQTPFFVKQGTGHEVFCHITPEMQTLARAIEAARLGKRALINRSARPKPSQPRPTWPDQPSGWPRTQTAG